MTAGQDHGARLVVERNSHLHLATIAALTRQDGLTVLLHVRADEVDVPPNPDAVLQPGDEIIVLASPDKLHEIAKNHDL